MRVCYFGIYDPKYPRNTILRKGLIDAGAVIIECRCPIEIAPGHMLGTHGTGFNLGRIRYEIIELVKAVKRIYFFIKELIKLRKERADAIIIAEFNQSLVVLTKIFSKLYRIPIIVDFLISLYITAVYDRKLLKFNRPRAHFRRVIDKLVFKLSQKVLVDTPAMADYYVENFGAEREKMSIVPVGFREEFFSPAPLPARGDRPLNVLYYGNFIPLHGVKYILNAAKKLKGDKRFRFTIIGSGQEHQKIKTLYAASPSGNVHFLPWPDIYNLYNHICEADICLGIFGTSDKAKRVIPNKVWECLAVGRPVITGNGKAATSLLKNEYHCLLVPHGNSEAIVNALCWLADNENLAKRLSSYGSEFVLKKYSSKSIGKRLFKIIKESIQIAKNGE